MTPEAPKEFDDPFNGDDAYWARTNLTAKKRAALAGPASQLKRPETGMRNASSSSLPLAGVEASDNAVTAASAGAETVELPVADAFPSSEAGPPARSFLANVMGVEIPTSSHPQPE